MLGFARAPSTVTAPRRIQRASSVRDVASPWRAANAVKAASRRAPANSGGTAMSNSTADIGALLL